jgi:hypothetical protein
VKTSRGLCEDAAKASREAPSRPQPGPENPRAVAVSRQGVQGRPGARGYNEKTVV